MNEQILIGIDVGGTFTDAVAVRDGAVIATAKVPTEPGNLAHSLLGALDGVLANVQPQKIARVSLSTTLITNLLAQKRAPEVATLLIPGPGRDARSYHLPGKYWTVGGAINFRGREETSINRAEVIGILREIHGAGYRHLAVVGKFSPRNPHHEEQITAWAREMDDNWHVRAGHTVSGQLNFPRRAAATALTLVIEEPYRHFFNQLHAAFSKRGLTCPMVILKADGGTLPLDAAEREPIQSIFSGPVASTMGALALRPAESTSVVVDVGGSTTDLALILDGEPLFASRGASLEKYYLPTRAFAVRSLPVGGDSTIAVENGAIILRETRAGVAACLGGSEPTLTDALRVLGRTMVGDERTARAALGKLEQDVEEIATRVAEMALARIETGIAEMFRAWQREPIYRIWELRQRGRRRPDTVVGVGAAAEAVVPALAERLRAEVRIPPYAPVANALGAAVARTTYTTTLHIDTEHNRLEIAEEGISEELPRGSYSLADAKRIAREWMARRGAALGLADPLADCEEVLAEQFNVVEGWFTKGRIFDVQLARGCGLVEEWKREGAA